MVMRCQPISSSAVLYITKYVDFDYSTGKYVLYVALGPFYDTGSTFSLFFLFLTDGVPSPQIVGMSILISKIYVW